MNPFDDPERGYTVLIGERGRYSLWPAGLDVPAGWTVVHGEDARTGCLAYVDRHWTEPHVKAGPT